ncbi:MAG: hypothetical protein AAF609_02585 [Cyanobacteria bacterium P01_C01_bin.120]
MTRFDPSMLRARDRLIFLFVISCTLDALLVLLAKDLWAIARIAFTIAVMTFVLQGRRWAKWLLIVLCGLLAFALVALLLLLSSELSAALTLGSWMMIALSLVISIYLVMSTDLNRYFAQQRQLRRSQAE